MAEQRLTEQGERIDAELLRDFVHRALAHDAVADPVFELLYAHVADGQLDASLVAASLKPLIVEVLDAATVQDWRAVSDQLIDEAREALAC